MDKRLYRILLTIAAILVTAGAVAAFLLLQKPKVLYCDVDGDGSQEIFTLKYRALTVEKDGAVIWESDDDWRVDDFLVYDINADGSMDLLVLLWKRGSFGAYAPIWVDKEADDEMTQHMFIYSWEDGWRPLWMSSKLIPEIREWNMTEEGKIHIITDSGEDTLWQWGSWGIERYK